MTEEGYFRKAVTTFWNGIVGPVLFAEESAVWVMGINALQN